MLQLVQVHQIHLANRSIPEEILPIPQHLYRSWIKEIMPQWPTTVYTANRVGLVPMAAQAFEFLFCRVCRKSASSIPPFLALRPRIAKSLGSCLFRWMGALNCSSQLNGCWIDHLIWKAAGAGDRRVWRNYFRYHHRLGQFSLEN